VSRRFKSGQKLLGCVRRQLRELSRLGRRLTNTPAPARPTHRNRFFRLGILDPIISFVESGCSKRLSGAVRVGLWTVRRRTELFRLDHQQRILCSCIPRPCLNGRSLQYGYENALSWNSFDSVAYSGARGILRQVVREKAIDSQISTTISSSSRC
jgi:hypothetical protein